MQKIKYPVILLLLVLTHQACKTKYQLKSSKQNLYQVNSTMTQDSAILKYTMPFHNRLDSIMNKVVAVADKEIKKSLPEGPLNNLFADAMFYSGKKHNIEFDFAYTNYGGLRMNLPAGDIKTYQVYELMPFENYFTTVKFKGEDIKAFFDYVAKSGGDPISGAKFKIRNDKAEDIFIGGKPFDIKKPYIILTSDYMANGGDGGEIFYKATNKQEEDLKLRDAIFEYFEAQTKAGKTLNPQKDGRITAE